jgi:predicted ArsR family transcriptional regulator
VEAPELRFPSVLPGAHGTKLTLLQLLLGGGATVESLAEAARIHRTVARRHLTDLLGAGWVAAMPLRGSRGRPRMTYSLTTEARELFYPRYGVILDCLTRASLRRTGAGRTRALFEEAAANCAGDLGFPASNGALAGALRAVGFQPDFRKERGKRLVVSHNCPIFGQAQKHPELLCEAFHSRLLTEAQDGWKATLRQTMARGATECIHVLTRDRDGRSSSRDGRDPPSAG